MIKKNKSNLKLIELLHNQKVTIASINLLMASGMILVVKKKSKIIQIGDVCDKAFFILGGGFISRVYNQQTKKSRTQNFFLEDHNQFMSCEDSYFTGEKTNTDLLAIKDSIIIQFLKKDVERLCESNKDFNNFYNNFVIVNALKQESALRKMVNAFSKEDLYNHLIDNYNSVIKNVPAIYIAEFIGISAEWLSKIKKKI
jgi:signal-transduction protein with cAMP-binding, CBS, and nucleotidyltransferase domain